MKTLKIVKTQFKTKYIIIASVVVFLLIAAAGSVIYYQTALGAVQKDEEKVSFVIEEGASLYSVIDDLQEQGLIKNATMAKIYTKLHRFPELVPGSYRLDKSWGTKDIIAFLTREENILLEDNFVLFREGLWAKDIAEILAKNTSFKAQEFIDLWNDEAYLKQLMKNYDFLTSDIFNSEYHVKLEGYLFPDTYKIEEDMSKEDITAMFLNRFSQVYETYEDDFKNSDKSIQEIMTLASMVQYEGSTKEDMFLISGVFANRLQKGMKLESSVTVCYALYDYEKPEECEINYTIASPYNTYLHEGIPIGPILNPGEVAIEAALRPKKSDYLFFMADIYGDHKVYYAKTYAEHETNVNKYLRK